MFAPVGFSVVAKTLSLVALAALSLVLGSFVMPAAARTVTPPDHATSPGVDPTELAKQCLRLYVALPKRNAGEEQVRAAAETCRKAIEKSGLSSGDFWARYRPLLDASGRTPTSDIPNADVDALIRECRDRYFALRDRSAALNNEQSADDVKAICERAISESGLSAEEFVNKYLKHPKPAEQPVSETSPLYIVNLCVNLGASLTAESTGDQIKATAEACTRAIAGPDVSLSRSPRPVAGLR